MKHQTVACVRSQPLDSILFRDACSWQPETMRDHAHTHIRSAKKNGCAPLAAPAGWDAPDRLMLRGRSTRSPKEVMNLLRSEGSIFVGIHRLEDALVSRLKLLQ